MTSEALAIAAEWTIGTGLARVPKSEDHIRQQARELLAEGHSAAHLALVARWMGGRGYRDLGYALTAKDAPKAPPGPRRGAPHCGSSHCVSGWLQDDIGTPLRRCPQWPHSLDPATAPASAAGGAA